MQSNAIKRLNCCVSAKKAAFTNTGGQLHHTIKVQGLIRSPILYFKNLLNTHGVEEVCDVGMLNLISKVSRH
jgi:hypothetical protein